MTLILGYAADEFAILASDRMIEWTMDDGSKRYEEQVCKVVSFAGRYMFGFAGAADIGGNTSRWLLEELVALAGRKPRPDIGDHLIDSLTRDLPDRKGIALLGVGFDGARTAQGEMVVGKPRLVVISNATRERLGSWSVQRGFALFEPTLPIHARSFRFWAVGITPSKERLKAAGDKIRRYRKRNPDRCWEIIKEMANVIVESKHPGVGTTVQVVIMPQAACGQETISIQLEFSEPLTDVTSVEFNPMLSDDGFVLINGHDLVCSDGTAYFGTVISPGHRGLIGPPPPFAPPPV